MASLLDAAVVESVPSCAWSETCVVSVPGWESVVSSAVSVGSASVPGCAALASSACATVALRPVIALIATIAAAPVDTVFRILSIA
ncbi:TPA: hypothetical protein JAK05_002206 [Corynebacterium striatum]|nr:hypothetical protein [Corynebacterium striatum]HAT6569748.1 hypothetical protein [Corynebacterium striatum]